MFSCHHLLKIHDTSTVYMIQINALCVIYFFILFIFKSSVVFFLLEYGCEIQLQVFFCVLFVVVAFFFPFINCHYTFHVFIFLHNSITRVKEHWYLIVKLLLPVSSNFYDRHITDLFELKCIYEKYIRICTCDTIVGKMYMYLIYMCIFEAIFH